MLLLNAELWTAEGGSGMPPWILKISEKNGCFLSFEYEKTNFTSSGPP